MRLDTFLFELIRFNQKYHRKDICTALSIRGAFQPSSAQKEFNSLHVDDSGEFDIVQDQNEFKLSRILGDCEVMYIVSRNMQICNRDLCRVTCEKCPPGHCLHEFICSCEYYSYRNMCSHTHLVCRHISGADSCGEAPTAGIEAATVEIQSREEDHDNSSVQVTVY